MEVVELVGAFARLQVYHSCRKESKAYGFTASLLLLYCCFAACRYTTHAAKRVLRIALLLLYCCFTAALLLLYCLQVYHSCRKESRSTAQAEARDVGKRKRETSVTSDEGSAGRWPTASLRASVTYVLN